MARYKRSEITREKIFGAACRLFGEKGYAETSIRDICEQAGVSVSRVNYHFASKAELAVEICRACLENFHEEIRKTIGSERPYSFLTDVVALRFYLRLFSPDGDNEKVGRFYRQIAREGIWADAVAEATSRQFLRAMEAMGTERTPEAEQRALLFARVYAMSLTGIIKTLDSGESGDLSDLQDCYAGLFLRMLDMDHDAQKALLALAAAYDRRITVETRSLTEVKMTLEGRMDESEKRSIVGEKFDLAGGLPTQ